MRVEGCGPRYPSFTAVGPFKSDLGPVVGMVDDMLCNEQYGMASVFRSIESREAI